MNNHSNVSLTKSIGNRLVILVVLLFIILIFIYWNAVSTVSENMFNSSRNVVELYKNDIDNKLRVSSDLLDELLYISSAFSSLQNGNQSEVYFASINILDTLESKLTYNECTDAFFVINSDNNIALVRFGARVGTTENMKINQYIRSDVFHEDKVIRNEWFLHDFGELCAFIKTYRIGKTYVGAIVLGKTAVESIEAVSNIEEAGIILTDEGGKCFFVNGAGKEELCKEEVIVNSEPYVESYLGKYMLVTLELGQCKARISNYVERENVLHEISYVPYGIMLLGLLTIFYLVYVYVFLRNKVIHPISGLVTATEQVGERNWDFKIDDSPAMMELAVLENSFNNMVGEIKNLKIQSYEEQIERQKVELRYLQMQIKPHFYLNAMTTIHSMTYKNKNEQIRAYVEALSEHMRYTIREGVSYVSLAEEMKHVGDYVKMQEIRYAKNVFLMVDMKEDTKEINIPQFLILTFIENTFKYAMSFEKLLSIYVRSNIELRDEVDCLHIHIEDNGDGFKEDILEKINSNELIPEGTEKGIGIQNIRRTLRLFYNDNASIIFSNTLPTGACIDIWIEQEEIQQ